MVYKNNISTIGETKHAYIFHCEERNIQDSCETYMHCYRPRVLAVEASNVPASFLVVTIVFCRKFYRTDKLCPSPGRPSIRSARAVQL